MSDQKTMDISGDLFIISAPSGAGKTSLVKSLLKSDLGLNLSVSHTTRPPRSSEVDGEDYHFVSRETSQRMLNTGEGLESAEVYGNFYGTSEKWIHDKISTGQNIILEIDCQGAKQVQRIFTQSIGIFILPPSLDALAMRLSSRSQDGPEVIQKRLAAVREEISHIHDFDYIIINNQLEYALHELICIIKAERLRRHRQLIKYHTLISQLS